MREIPVLCRWDGETLRPLGSYWFRKAAETWTVGERYHVEAIEQRSINSHRHYFAAIDEAWTNLSDSLIETFPTPEHLRKYALIQTGYYDEKSIVCSSPEEAIKIAAFVDSMDDFSVVSVASIAVVVRTPKTQNMREMGRHEFQRSKDAVLNFVSELIGSDVSGAIGPAPIDWRDAGLQEVDHGG